MNEGPQRIHGLDRHATVLPGQWLYLFGDGGVIYSDTKSRFAGLDAKGVSAYLAFEAGASVRDLRRFDGNQGSTESGGGLEQIYALTQGVFPEEEPANDWPASDDEASADLRSGTKISRREAVEIAGIPVSLEYPAGELESLCRDYFRNCPPATDPPRCHVSALCCRNRWAVYVNGREFLSPQNEEQLGLGLMHAARAMLYAEAHYDVAFHASVVAHEDRAVLLCAPREFGKSTLAAYLSAHGFDLLADEPALLHLDSCALSSFPLPISIKEGSWPFLQQELPQFSCGPVHFRSDGVRILLAHSPLKRRAGQARLSQIIFPNYDPSSPANVERLSPLRTLELLNDGGMLMAKNLGRDKFEDLLVLLCQIPAHRIRYASLQEAWRLLLSCAMRD